MISLFPSSETEGIIQMTLNIIVFWWMGNYRFEYIPLKRKKKSTALKQIIFQRNFC